MREQAGGLGRGKLARQGQAQATKHTALTHFLHANPAELGAPALPKEAMQADFQRWGDERLDDQAVLSQGYIQPRPLLFGDRTVEAHLPTPREGQRAFE